jgi:hypothetical protein
MVVLGRIAMQQAACFVQWMGKSAYGLRISNISSRHGVTCIISCSDEAADVFLLFAFSVLSFICYFVWWGF